MSDIEPLGRPLPDLRNVSLASLVADRAGLVAEFRIHVVTPETPVRMAAFNSEIGGDKCLPSSTSTS
ncbi:hypothetical protein OG259_02815 [Streptomyces sp. NBC_00250]|uniref:hypothetical protein n=1 Tax=unclassified Streptomyces TaxID=2593676 RepID=UPI002259604A|nr:MULTISPECIES: hypothetical protein [unclassified Streptomyces]MCX4985354.1 hypothetical protein [Streptomyces sp. NBC_00572]